MKKIIVLMLVIAVISSFTLADNSLGISFNSVELAMLNDGIDDTYDTEPTSDPSNDKSGDNTNPNENNNESTTEPNEAKQENDLNPDENNPSNESTNPEEPSAEEPSAETPNFPTTPIEINPIETEIPAKPVEVGPPKPAPIINTLNRENAWSNKTVYLTFDDGPSSLTIKVLDLLKKENIKATFFTIGTKTDEGKDILKRIANEGHSLGNHTYSHNYNYIYRSIDNFFDDLYKNENIIYEASGKRPKIIRFPGGSSNATTKTENGKKVMSEIMNRLEKEGYIHFDWNASSGDASAVPASVDDIVNNTLTWVNKNNTAVVLFHDTAAKTNTLKALPIIIEKLKFLGCKFEVLTTSSPHIAFVKNNNNEAVPASTDTNMDNPDIISNDTNTKKKKPSYVIKKLMRLEMEIEKRFSENGH